VLAGLAIVLIGSHGLHGQPPAKNKSEPIALVEPVLKGLDPVALAKGKELAGNKDITSTKNGFRYQFATEENRKTFEREPGRYSIQLDGHCAAMPSAQGDPDLFAVVKGRIYVFGTPECRDNFTANPEKYVKSRRNVAVFVHEGVELLDFAGPAEVFAAAGHHEAFNVYTVAASDGEIKSQGFLTVKPQYTFANCPKPDIIVLPGGNTGIPLKDERVIQWIQQRTEETEISMSVCTGAFLLAKAGLLDGKDATTHWGSIDALKKDAPKAKVHSDRRFLDNGKIVTCAGVSAGIDGALHVVERLLGKATAEETARYMEYRWQPDPK
jgi:putative intracellular protease/amidase/YHS domain-containing protein